MGRDLKIIPVIVSGGAGSRLWPASRQAMPKQLLALVTDKTMVQETAERLTGDVFQAPVFICNAAHADLIKAQMASINQDVAQIIVEPVGRNTAPCAVVAACHALANDPEALILLAPADHHVTKPGAFRRSVAAAIPAAKAGHLVTFGIQASAPETGYGYIERGEAISPGVYDVKAFKEKPDEATAKTYVASGDYQWNAGIFLFSPNTLLEEMKTYHPDIVSSASQAYTKAHFEGQLCRLDVASFVACPSQSIDYAVMEPTQMAAVVPCDIGWNDIGSFASLHTLKKSDNGNALKGDVICEETTNCLVQTDGPLVTTVGLDGMCVIVHDGAILVAKLDAAQDVKQIVQSLKSRQRAEML